MNDSLEIRLGRKRIAVNNKCELIEIKDIKSVPLPRTFIEESVNRKIQEEARNTLKLAMSDRKYQYGEVAILFSTLDDTVHAEYEGKFNEVIFRDTNFNDIIAKRTKQDLILVHNHPDNSIFSGADILTLCSNYTLLAIVAVGNTKSMHILIKSWSRNNSAVQYIINKAEQLRQQENDKAENIKKYRDIAALDILRNPNKFGLQYERYNRRHVL